MASGLQQGSQDRRGFRVKTRGVTRSRGKPRPGGLNMGLSSEPAWPQAQAGRGDGSAGRTSEPVPALHISADSCLHGRWRSTQGCVREAWDAMWSRGGAGLTRPRRPPCSQLAERDASNRRDRRPGSSQFETLRFWKQVRTGRGFRRTQRALQVRDLGTSLAANERHQVLGTGARSASD